MTFSSWQRTFLVEELAMCFLQAREVLSLVVFARQEKGGFFSRPV
jgi:hypothetical protein